MGNVARNTRCYIVVVYDAEHLYYNIHNCELWEFVDHSTCVVCLILYMSHINYALRKGDVVGVLCVCALFSNRMRMNNSRLKSLDTE